ncbi:MAG: ATP-dependent zinc metalloprotease FtsH [Syntrophobacteraceae bacterium]|nr:ATP-dependent zinc metalloprotease FtsH [Syntrophobacteraceae bacterium]
MAKIIKRDEDSSPISKIIAHIKSQGKSGPNQGDPAKKKMQLSIWYFIAAMLLIFWFQGHMGGQQPETVDYSTFKQWVQNGTVESVLIGPEQITGMLKGEKGKPAKTFVTVRVEDPTLVGQLEQKGIKFSGHVESKWLGALMSWVLPLGIFVFIWFFLMKRMAGGPQGVLSLGKAQVKIYGEKDLKVTFEDVAGIDEAKGELEEVVEFLKNPQKSQRLGGRIPKGVLLVGSPGTGKTLLARAVAGEAGVMFFSMSGSEFVEMIVGVGAARIRDLFKQAREHAPCIIFLDEMDALGKARGMNPMGGHDEREQTLNQLLVEMDGFDPSAGVIILAATNRPDVLDPALLRPGRFDRNVAIDKPDIRGREAILKVHAKNVQLGPDVDLKKVAAMTPGFVGADLANLINEAALIAARGDADEVTMTNFQQAAERIMGGLEKKNRVMSQKEKEIVAYHESGHAVVAMLLPGTDPVSKISIIPRGIAALGYTQQLPIEDRYLMTRDELLDRLQVLLGGRVAEEVIFKDISTGAQNDLQRASDIAGTMVMQYGMSERLGLLTYTHTPQSRRLDLGFGSNEREYSEHTARQIDEEKSRIMDEAHQKVLLKLEHYRDSLEKLARILLDKETIGGDELKQFAQELRGLPSEAGNQPPIDPAP